jgi:hypothetical protein
MRAAWWPPRNYHVRVTQPFIIQFNSELFHRRQCRLFSIRLCQQGRDHRKNNRRTHLIFRIPSASAPSHQRKASKE